VLQVRGGEGAQRVSALDTDHFRELLLDARKRVVAALQNLHDDHAGTLSDEETAYDNHLADTATETYDRELDYTLEENSEHVLADIDAALKRIEDGTYGICTNGGEQIPAERLEALPWATLCIDCKQRERR
jgi:DnaK suppressor protein